MGERTACNLESFRIEDLELFRKRKTKIHFIRSMNIGKEGETIDIPTLEENIKVKTSNNMHIMIGLY